MPIYPYECTECGHSFERVSVVATKRTWKEESKRRVMCPECNKMKAKKIVGGFKIGGGLLDTTGKSGYMTDDLTVGKVIDEGGIPYEFNDKIKERQEMIKRQVEYKKELAERSKRFGFNPAGNEED